MSQSLVAPVDRAATCVAPRGVRAEARRRLVVVGCWVGLAGAGVVVAGTDPGAAGSHFPPCLFHAATGLWCPGCGLTRAAHALLNGHVGAALGFNVFIPLVVAALAFGMVTWTRAAWGRPPSSRLTLPAPIRHRLGSIVPVLLLGFGVLRNVPSAPFRALAP